jgi:hypothetical protein
MEFFLMLFRHLTQTVISKLKRRMKAADDDIDAIGRAANRRQRRLYFFQMFLLMLGSIAAGWSLFGLQEHNFRIREAQIRVNRISSPNFLEEDTRRVPTQQEYENRASAKKEAEDNLARIQKQSWPWLNGTDASQPTVLLFAAIIFLGCGALFARILFERRHTLPPLESGLLIYSERLSRKLDYELTTKGEWAAEITPLKWLKLSNSKSNEEKVRPLTLPELTADYIEFVSNVLRVFEGKLLICIDELDKVTDLDQVRFILREIKGALYVKGTFYMLSISNDALRSFEGRLGDQRDIFESTFDDVFAVRSLDLESSVSILSNRLKSLGTHRKEWRFNEGSLIVIAVFSAGNARDLIRGFRECAISVGTSEKHPSETWALLFERRAESILDRVVAVKGIDESRSKMIGLVEEVIDGHFVDAILKFRSMREQLRVLVTPVISPDDKETLNRLTRYCTELEILLCAKQRVADQTVSESMMRDASMIMKAYQLLPFSHSDSEKILSAIDKGDGEMPNVRHHDSSVKSVLSAPVADRKTDKPTAI